jgi:hypothetical protein
MFDWMHMMREDSLPLIPELLKFQLSLLNAYEGLLKSQTWDKAQLNQVLKEWMSSLLPLVQSGEAMREQLVEAQKQVLEQYRHCLEEALRRQSEPH